MPPPFSKLKPSSSAALNGRQAAGPRYRSQSTSSLGGSGSAGEPAAADWCSCRPDGRRRCGACRACRCGPARRRTRSGAGFAAACRPGRRGRCGASSRPASGSGRCSSCRASRSTCPCRPWAAYIAAVACQFGPVAISTASMSSRASSSRKSRYVAQSWLPYLASTIFLTGVAARGLHVADGHELHVRLLAGSSPGRSVPRLPMPMPPITIRSLGATAPLLPRAVPGMK